MAKKKFQIRNSTAEFLIFTNQVKEEGIEVRLQDGQHRIALEEHIQGRGT